MSKKKQAGKPLYPVVTVKWVDTVTVDTWIDIEDAKLIAPLECASTGYLIHETDSYIALVQTIGDNKRCFGIAAIPRPMIVEVLQDE